MADGDYERMTSEALRSQLLGLELRVEDGALRLYDMRTGHKLLTPAEQADARR